MERTVNELATAVVELTTAMEAHKCASIEQQKHVHEKLNLFLETVFGLGNFQKSAPVLTPPMSTETAKNDPTSYLE